MQEKTFRSVRIERGAQGWGGPLVIQPTAEKDKIVAVTGGNIPEVAKKIAELTGAEVVDGFRTPPLESEIAAVVVDCGGTARAGVYPRKRIPTINLTPVGQAGPLAQFITEDIYVSGVGPNNVEPTEGAEAAADDGGQEAPSSPFAATSAGTGPATGGGSRRRSGPDRWWDHRLHRQVRARYGRRGRDTVPERAPVHRHGHP